jgi:hypothetical protein
MKNSPRNILFKFFFRSFLITSRYKIQPAKNTKKAIGIYILNIILFVLSEVIINFYCLLRCRFSIATNGFGLCEEAELEAQMFGLAQMSIRIPNVQFSTEPAFSQNPCLWQLIFIVV